MTRLAIALLTGLSLMAQTRPLPPDPPFNRLHDNDAILGFLRGYAAAYPDLVKLESLGKSTQGQDLWCLTVHNPKTGRPDQKPAAWIDGATHGNEVQGTETALYTLHTVLTQYGKRAAITELVDRAVLYFIPMVNVDGRRAWFKGPAGMNTFRGLFMPVDDDRDGRVDEDGPEDLNGDGLIAQMRQKVLPGLGTHRLDPKDPRILAPVEPGEKGDYVLLGEEGIDNDGDGLVNEDGPGYVDTNRIWGYDFAPRYVQSGAPDYPLQPAEGRALALFQQAHPHVSLVMSFHNTGRMILRGPGARTSRPWPAQDIKAFDLMGREGEKMLPGYRYMVSWKDLYVSYGDSTDHAYGTLGALGFVNELWGPPADLQPKAPAGATSGNAFGGGASDQDRMKWNDRLTFGRQFVLWKPFQHPQYGAVEIGGWAKDTNRMPEGWLLEEECHRNAAFTLHCAMQVPQLSVLDQKVTREGRDTWRITLTLRNDRVIPSVPGGVLMNRLHRMDLATLEGVKVLASGIVTDRLRDTRVYQEHRPERLLVPGVPGEGTTTLFFLVQGGPEARFTYDSVKGGVVKATVSLK